VPGRAAAEEDASPARAEGRPVRRSRDRIEAVALRLRYDAGAIAAMDCALVEERELVLAHVVWPSEAVLRASVAVAEELVYGTARPGSLLDLALDRGRALRVG